MNITEDYVSFEIAKLLKEKGFNEKVSTHYLIHPSGFSEFFDKKDEFTEPEDVWLKCPTHQMAMKWLRKKGIYIYIQPTKYVGGALYGFQSIIEDGRNDDWKRHIHHEDNYKEAVEAAIKYCLENLI